MLFCVRLWLWEGLGAGFEHYEPNKHNPPLRQNPRTGGYIVPLQGWCGAVLSFERYFLAAKQFLKVASVVRAVMSSDGIPDRQVLITWKALHPLKAVQTESCIGLGGLVPNSGFKGSCTISATTHVFCCHNAAKAFGLGGSWCGIRCHTLCMSMYMCIYIYICVQFLLCAVWQHIECTDREVNKDAHVVTPSITTASHPDGQPSR